MQGHTHGWGEEEGSGAEDEAEERPQQHEQTEARTEDGKEERGRGGGGAREGEEERREGRQEENGRSTMEKEGQQASVEEKKKKTRRRQVAEGRRGGTCAGPVVGGLHPGGLGAEGALLQRRGAVQAALAHSVQVAAICPNTRGRYGGGGDGSGWGWTGVGGFTRMQEGVKPEESASPGKPPPGRSRAPPPRQAPRCFSPHLTGGSGPEGRVSGAPV